jgi:hypothetical protein
MKRIAIIATLALLSASAGLVQASDDNLFQELVVQQLTAISDSIAKPAAEIFSTGATGGWFRSADAHGLLGFDVGIRAMFVRVPDGKSGVFDSAGVSYFPVGLVQASVGLPMDFEVTLRGFHVNYKEAKVSFFGAGVKKNFNSMIPVPMFPDVAAFLAYEKFRAAYTTFDVDATQFFDLGYPVTAEVDAGDLINSSHFSLGVIVSKKLSLLVFSLQPYVGLTWDHSKMKYKWTVNNTDPAVPSLTLPLAVSSEITANATRLTLGLDVSPFPFIHVFGDYSISKYNQYSAGLAFSFR